MRYGIYDITKVAKNEAVVKCNNCDNFFYEDITDERNDNALELIYDGHEYFRGCPVCKTDSFLGNVELSKEKTATRKKRR